MKAKYYINEKIETIFKIESDGSMHGFDPGNNWYKISKNVENIMQTNKHIKNKFNESKEILETEAFEWILTHPSGTRRLMAHWSIDICEDLKYMNGINVIEEIQTHFQKEQDLI